jgi:hypothetical protein
MSANLIAELAYNIVEQFGVEWQAQPYYWDREIDVKVELASRLKTALRLLGLGDVIGCYPSEKDVNEQRIVFSRVRCDATVYLGSPKRRSGDRQVRPDIVIWDDLEDPDTAENCERGDMHWPIIWACELKYMGDTSQDSDKLLELLAKGRIQRACLLDIHWEEHAQRGILSRNPPQDERLRHYDLYLASQEGRRQPGSS